MGSRLCALAHADERFDIAAAIDRAGSTSASKPCASDDRRGAAVPITHDLAAIMPGSAHVVIDFSSAEATDRAIDVARRAGAALLVGTTGLSESMQRALREEARHRAVLLAPNTSLGVAVLASLVAAAARTLHGFDVSIVEAHHNKKKDAPSGTAIRLAHAARAGGAALKDDQVVAIRGGDVIGEHTVRFAGDGEYIELTHRATSRDLFVRGALRAALWLRTAQPGWWTIEDTLGLSR